MAQTIQIIVFSAEIIDYAKQGDNFQNQTH